jgi:hypothetical protein
VGQVKLLNIMALSNLEKTILDTIAYYEGTLGKSQNGFNTLFGGKKTINGWTEDTTRIRHRCIRPTPGLSEKTIIDEGFVVCQDTTWESVSWLNETTEAGRYQYVGDSWALKTKKLGLGFNAPMSTKNQNTVAVEDVRQAGVTEADLKNALNSIIKFWAVIKKLEKKWVTLTKVLNGNFHKTIEMGWVLYKGAYGKYTTPNNGTASNLNTSNSKTIYINAGGFFIPKFGTTTTISTTTDSDKFYVNTPSDSEVSSVIFFWCGYETLLSRKKQWDQIPIGVKEKNYIIMGNFAPYVNGNYNYSVDGLVIPFKSFFVRSGGDYKKMKDKNIMGYSAGGRVIFNNYEKSPFNAGGGKIDSYKICGLIDPSLSSPINTEDRTYSSNAVMVWGSDDMVSYSSWGVRYPILENKIKDGKGFVTKVPGLDHKKAIQKWFELYGTKFNGGETPPVNSTPNASKLRRVMANLKIREKVYTTAYTVAQIAAQTRPKSSGTGPNFIVPTVNPNTGEWKLLLNQTYTDGEMSNGGDISENIARVASALFSKIYELTDIKIKVTGGNDSYHQSYNNNSRHKKGNGIDFTVSKTSSVDLDRVITIIQGFVGGEYPNVRYLDEYREGTTNGTGAHFHLSWGAGEEGLAAADIAKNKTDTDQIPTYTA